MRLFVGYKAWKEKEYLLNRMTFDDLVRAYITYPGIQIYFVLILACLIAAGFMLTGQSMMSWGAAMLALGVGMLLFPIMWYVTHRFILHSSWMYKTPHLARFWKRVHYDHHRFPNDLSVLYGGLHTTLPPILFVAGPIGWAISGGVGALMAITGTLIMTCITEFLHSGQHLAFEPKSAFWQRIKKLHLAHHFHNENGNYGIAEFFWDRILGTYYPETEDVERSATARNLGYTSEMAKKYPWVKELTDAEPLDKSAQRTAAV